MNTSCVEDLLRQTIGLDTASVGSRAIERAVKRRLSAVGGSDPGAYLDQLLSSPAELQELIEEVIVPETWFFRDSAAFAALTRLVAGEWMPAHPTGLVRVLSVPCATGEEPYSLAISLRNAGLPLERIHIAAVDISQRALSVARSAVYTRNSFRGRDLEYRDIYFEPVGHGYRLMENIRAHVQFQHANLLGPDFHLDRGNYHFIFCRNLLIYFDRPTQDRAVQTLTGLLAPDGVLFVGPAEAGLMVNHGFVSAKLPLAFAFRRATAAAPVQLEPGNARPPRRKSAVAPAATPAPLRSRSPAKPQVSSATRLQPEVDGKPKADLKLAAQLADQGRMDEAARMCADYLRDHQPTAPAFYLLGVLSDAAGDIQEASQYYRKALYLQPDHYEAMMHLAYSTEKLGGVAAARNLRARARRLKERMDHA